MNLRLCAICNSSLDDYLQFAQDPESLHIFEIMHCKKCSIEQTWPQPADLSPYYTAQYYGDRHGFTAKYCVWRRLRWVSRFYAKQTIKLLDIGCGDGSFLLSAQKKGWAVYGTEVNIGPARKEGLKVKQDLAAMGVDAPFDCVTLWHSLEHMRNPRKVLNQVHKLLTNNGLVFIAVPNAAGWQGRLFGGKWLHCDVPRHLFHFRLDSLQSMLSQSGFKILNSWHQEFEYDLLGWAQSLLNSLSSIPNIFFKKLTGRKTGVGYLTEIIHGLGGILFCVAALPIVPLSALFKSGGTLIVVAQRQGQDIILSKANKE